MRGLPDSAVSRSELRTAVCPSLKTHFGALPPAPSGLSARRGEPQHLDTRRAAHRSRPRANAGVHIPTGEEVGIKLVRRGAAVPRGRWPCRALPRRFALHPRPRSQPGAAVRRFVSPAAGLQESTKTKHPQLLYESKLYKILQGGSACPTQTLVGCRF